MGVRVGVVYRGGLESHGPVVEPRAGSLESGRSQLSGGVSFAAGLAVSTVARKLVNHAMSCTYAGLCLCPKGGTFWLF